MNPRPEHFDALAHAIRTCSSPSRRRDLEEIRSFLSTVSADLSDIDDGEPDDNDDNDIASLKARIAELEARCKAQHEVMTDMVGKQREAASDLRERLVCAIWPEILRQWREYTGAIDPQYTNAIDPRGNARADALQEADKMLAAMRKGVA